MNSFLMVSNNGVVTHNLCTTIRSNGIGVLYGCSGSGTTTILKEAINRLSAAEDHRALRCVYAPLWRPAFKSRNLLATLAGFVTLNEVILGLSDLSTQYDTALVRRTTVWYREPKPTVTQSHFASMFSFARDECRRLRIDALLIDNADELDRFALQRLLDIRRMCGDALALIVCFKREFADAANEHAETLLHTTLEPFHPYDSFNLEPLTEHDVTHTIFIDFIRRYHLQVTATNEEVLRMRRQFWNETHGDWRRIQTYARRIGDYCHHTKQPVLSRAMWEIISQKSLSSAEEAAQESSRKRSGQQTAASK